MTRTPSLASLLLAGGLMVLTAIQPIAAPAQDLAVAPAPATAASAPAPPEPAPITILGWPVSQDLLVRGTSSIIGLIVFNVVMTSLTTVPAAGVAATPLATVLANRIVASSLAATAAVGTMFAYDKWTSRAMDYDYAWSRAGFVAGATAASAVLTGLGYSAGDWWTATWAANRAVLMGAGLLGGWSARHWYAGQ
jgi:hypothetical protein